MNFEDFVGLVAKMRRAQKRYFASKRSSDALAESKALEQQVDRAVAQLNPQPELFGENDHD